MAAEPRRGRHLHPRPRCSSASASTPRSPGRPRRRSTPRALVPDLGDISAKLNLWASIAFAFAGLELCAVMGGEVKDPRRTLPRSICISAPLIAFLYIAGHRVGAVADPDRARSTSSRASSRRCRRRPGHRVGRGLARPRRRRRSTSSGNVGGVGAWLTGPRAGGVRDRARPLLPAGLRPGAPPLADAVRRHPHPGGAGDGLPVRVGAGAGDDGRDAPTSSSSTRCCWSTSSPTSTCSSASWWSG